MRVGRLRTSALLATAALGLGLLASTSVAAPTTLKLKTVGACCKFDKTTLKAKAGVVVLVLKNTSGDVPHNVAVKGKGKAKIVTGGKSTTLRVTLKKGSYVFYCSVPGHQAAGMKGTIRVT